MPLRFRRLAARSRGPLLLADDPVSSLQATTKQDVDGQVAAAVPKTGGTLIGPLLLAADPASSLQAATKQYVDTRVSRAGETLTGALILASNPTTALQAATKGYVDAQVAGALPAAGGTLTGALTLAADPALSMQAATKHYVDARAAISLPISGGTLTGPLEQRSRQRRRQVGQRQPTRGIPRHRQHAAAGDAAPERSTRRCRPQLGDPAGDAVRRLLSAADGARSGVQPRNGQPRRRERLDLVSRLVTTELAARSLRSACSASAARRYCRRMACAVWVIGSCCSPAPAW